MFGCLFLNSRRRKEHPGAIASPTRGVLAGAEAEYYTVNRVLRGWNPLAR